MNHIQCFYIDELHNNLINTITCILLLKLILLLYISDLVIHGELSHETAVGRGLLSSYAYSCMLNFLQNDAI